MLFRNCYHQELTKAECDKDLYFIHDMQRETMDHTGGFNKYSPTSASRKDMRAKPEQQLVHLVNFLQHSHVD